MRKRNSQEAIVTTKGSRLVSQNKIMYSDFFKTPNILKFQRPQHFKTKSIYNTYKISNQPFDALNSSFSRDVAKIFAFC